MPLASGKSDGISAPRLWVEAMPDQRLQVLQQASRKAAVGARRDAVPFDMQHAVFQPRHHLTAMGHPVGQCHFWRRGQAAGAQPALWRLLMPQVVEQHIATAWRQRATLA